MAFYSGNAATASQQSPTSLPMQLIKEPLDTDVVGGRGGAAHRHPGNQVFRKIVQMNKGLYATCVKAEKLKISRSIVETIRENGGRFLELDKKTQTYFDIGDKKAMAKTSQALREGLPKIRQQIAANGGGAAGVAELLESEYRRLNDGSETSKKSEKDKDGFMKPKPQKKSETAQRGFAAKPQDPMFLPSEPSSSTFDLDGLSTITENTQAPLHPSVVTRGPKIHSDLGVDPMSALSLQSEFSQLSERSQFTTGTAGSRMSVRRGQRGSLVSVSEQSSNPSLDGPGVDRRNLFASMKYRRAPDGGRRHHGQASANSGDGMPSIHMVESNDGSMFSNLSSVRLVVEDDKTTSGETTNTKASDVEHIFESRLSLMSGISLLASDRSLMSPDPSQIYSL